MIHGLAVKLSIEDDSYVKIVRMLIVSAVQ